MKACSKVGKSCDGRGGCTPSWRSCLSSQLFAFEILYPMADTRLCRQCSACLSPIQVSKNTWQICHFDPSTASCRYTVYGHCPLRHTSNIFNQLTRVKRKQKQRLLLGLFGLRRGFVGFLLEFTLFTLVRSFPLAIRTLLPIRLGRCNRLHVPEVGHPSLQTESVAMR